MSHPKTCDDYPEGEKHNDYFRHQREGSKPCAASVAAHRKRQREVRARLRKGEKR